MSSPGRRLGVRRAPRGALLPLAAALLLAPPAAPGVAAQSSVPAADGVVTIAVPSMRVAAGTLRFDADATIGDFSGVTRAVTGEVYAATAPGVISGWVEAPVRSLRTGLRARDGHMYSTLGADRYPVVRFEPSAIEATARGDTARARITGTLTIHGVSRPLTVPLTAIRRADGVRVVGAFPVDANEFGISNGLVRMGGLLRVSPKMRVAVDLTFAPAPPRPRATRRQIPRERPDVP